MATEHIKIMQPVTPGAVGSVACVWLPSKQRFVRLRSTNFNISFSEPVMYK